MDGECTLTPKAMVKQQLEWADLIEIAIDRRAAPNGADMEFPSDRYEPLADLVARELACCGSWLTLELERRGSRIRLTATSDTDENTAAIRSMAGLEVSR